MRYATTRIRNAYRRHCELRMYEHTLRVPLRIRLSMTNALLVLNILTFFFTLTINNQYVSYYFIFIWAITLPRKLSHYRFHLMSYCMTFGEYFVIFITKYQILSKRPADEAQHIFTSNSICVKDCISFARHICLADCYDPSSRFALVIRTFCCLPYNE